MAGVEKALSDKQTVNEIIGQTFEAARMFPMGGFGRIPATLTANDIQVHYGIGRSKWMAGVKAGVFPKPIEGFQRPKRWRRTDVEAALGLREVA